MWIYRRALDQIQLLGKHLEQLKKKHFKIYFWTNFTGNTSPFTKKTLNFSTCVSLWRVFTHSTGFMKLSQKTLCGQKVLGLILDKLVSNKNDSKRHIFRLCLQPKCNRLVHPLTCTSLDLWCWEYVLEKLQRGLLWYLIEILAKKSIPNLILLQWYFLMLF